MRQRIAVFLAVLAALAVATTAYAQSKPAVAILGLEVIDNGSGIDPETTGLAKLLTQALRERTRLDTSPYRLAPNSEKALLELKLLSGCADEARNCMATIGRELRADWLVYGKIERRDTGFQVTLRLLNVDTMAMERVTTEVIPFADNNPPAINNKWSRVLFNRLTGIPEQGNLEIAANAGQGRVFVDGQLATTLRDGSTRIDGLAEGKHAVVIEAEGYARYETSVTIGAGQTESLDAQLMELSAPGAPAGEERSGGFARTMTWVSGAVALAAGGGLAFSGYKVRGFKSDSEKFAKANNSSAPDGYDKQKDHCGSENSSLDWGDREDEYKRICDGGEQYQNLSFVFGGVAAAAGVATVVFAYMGYFGDDDSSAERVSGKPGKRKERTVQFTPTITPDYVGGGVVIEF
ncbi:PEGA domain-containing protein [Haliangium ochraceum]|nr:PEGA domain-containing protein [Haliangium ochraceum]